MKKSWMWSRWILGFYLLGIGTDVQAVNLYLRSGSSTCTYNGSASQTLQSASGTSQAGIAFSAQTNQFSFYSAPLTNLIYTAAGKKAGGTIGVQNNGTSDFQFNAGEIVYDYDPMTGNQVQIVAGSASGWVTVGKNGKTGHAALPSKQVGGAGYTIPAGHILKAVVTVVVNLSTGINGALIYNAGTGDGKSLVQFPQDNSVLWPFGNFAATPNATITTSASVQQNSTGNVASVPNAGMGAAYFWTITNGTITAGQSTSQITWSAGTSGTVGLGISIVNGCFSASGAAVVTLNAKTNQTITFNPIPTQMYGNPPVTLVATGSSGLPVTFSLVSGPATVSGSTLTIIAAGTVVVDANQAGNSNYNPAVAQQSFTVNPVALTVSGITANDKVYDSTTTATLNTNGAALVGVIAGDSVILDFTFVAGYFTDGITGSGKTVQISGLDIDGASAGNYTLIPPATIANITAAPLTVTACDQTKICGQPNPTLTVSYSGFVSGEDATVLTSPAVLSTSATINSAAGTYPITASGAAAANYAINYATGTLTVAPAPQLCSSCVSMNGNSQFVMSWPTLTNQTYQIECATNLAAPTWKPCGGPMVGTGTTMVLTNNMYGTPQCFFRLKLQ
ncbi:MAG TPA: MBG domain-containing protein [Verrucomicrobiae bacterium]|nr:MBG domain-containing protein [Verrucomicrobiae bacterium]